MGLLFRTRKVRWPRISTARDRSILPGFRALVTTTRLRIVCVLVGHFFQDFRVKLFARVTFSGREALLLPFRFLIFRKVNSPTASKPESGLLPWFSANYIPSLVLGKFPSVVAALEACAICCAPNDVSYAASGQA